MVVVVGSCGGYVITRHPYWGYFMCLLLVHDSCCCCDVVLIFEVFFTISALGTFICEDCHLILVTMLAIFPRVFHLILVAMLAILFSVFMGW